MCVSCISKGSYRVCDREFNVIFSMVVCVGFLIHRYKLGVGRTFFFSLRFLDVDHFFFKSLLNLLQYCFCFVLVLWP